MLRKTLCVLTTITLTVNIFCPKDAHAQVQVTDVIDMEDGLSGDVIVTEPKTPPTTQHVPATNRLGGTPTGFWTSAPSAAAQQLYISNGPTTPRPARLPVKIGSTIYPGDASQRVLKKHLDSIKNLDYEFITYNLAPARPKVVVGFFIYFSSAGDGWTFPTPNYQSYDFFALTDTGGAYNVLNGNSEGHPLDLRIHTNPCGGGQFITDVVPDQWYWVTMLMDGPNHIAKTAIYNANTGASMGGTSQCDSGSSSSIDRIYFGESDRHDHTTRTVGADYFMDDLIIDSTGTTTFPMKLVPAIGSSSPQPPTNLSAK